jgi:hypothetical protein
MFRCLYFINERNIILLFKLKYLNIKNEINYCFIVYFTFLLRLNLYRLNIHNINIFSNNLI